MTHHHRGKSSENFIDKDTILLELHILPGQTILDAGCGNGYMAKEFAKLTGETGKVYAMDLDRESIDNLKAETAGLNIEAFIGDITHETRLEECSIDLIYLSTVIHEFSESGVAGFVRETKRLLKNCGKLAIVEIEKKVTSFGPPLDIRLSPEELRNTIDMKPVQLTEAGQFLYMQVFQK